jgi:hypothetical protein
MGLFTFVSTVQHKRAKNLSLTLVLIVPRIVKFFPFLNIIFVIGSLSVNFSCAEFLASWLELCLALSIGWR